MACCSFCLQYNYLSEINFCGGILRRYKDLSCNNRQTDHIYMKLTFTCGGPSVTPMLGWLPSWLVHPLQADYSCVTHMAPGHRPYGRPKVMTEQCTSWLLQHCTLLARSTGLLISFCHSYKRLIKSNIYKCGDETTFQMNQQSPNG